MIVIDEFQYIAKERPSILSELQVLWDEEQLSKLSGCGFVMSVYNKRR